jgi:hypothetical protein
LGADVALKIVNSTDASPYEMVDVMLHLHHLRSQRRFADPWIAPHDKDTARVIMDEPVDFIEDEPPTYESAGFLFNIPCVISYVAPDIRIAEFSNDLIVTGGYQTLQADKICRYSLQQFF